MKKMNKSLALLLALTMILALCACGAQTAVQKNESASDQIAAEQSKAGVVNGTVSHLSTSRMLVVESQGNVYCFDIPIDTDTTNMVAGNTVTVNFTGDLDANLGTAFQNVTVTGITFAEIVVETPVPVVTTAPTATPTPDPMQEAATETAEGNAIMYMWTDGSVHDTPEEGQTAVTKAQVATIQFNEPQLTGPVNSCNGTVIGTVEDDKYLLLDDGAGHRFLFYIENKPQVSYDGTGIEPGANCSVLYIGTLNPYYGESEPQYVTVQEVQTDSKAYYYASIAQPQTTSSPSVTPGPNGMWYGTDGKLHWYGSDGKVYNYDSNGNIVLS